MQETEKKLSILYLANVHVPNVRANGVQIAHTCEELGKHVNLTLATRMTYAKADDISARYGTERTFIHKRLFCIDIPGLPFRYFVRNASFFVSANVYALWFFLKHLVSGKKAAMYVRGEVILALIPLAVFFPIFFETHQIRNYAWLYRIALRLSKGIVVVTDRLKQKFVEEYKIPAEKILVARDAVDVRQFENVVPDTSVWQSHGIPPGKKVILYAGTLAPEKGVHTLAKATALLPHDIQIVFLGGTDEQVQSFRAQYAEIPNITIVGRVSHTDVPRYIVSADVLVLPDSAEFTYSNLYTSPMKLFEYMVSGRPIVASDVPSLREVLSPDTAFFFAPDSTEALAEEIQSMLDNPEEAGRLSDAAREAVSSYTWDKRGNSLAEHVTKLLKVE